VNSGTKGEGAVAKGQGKGRIGACGASAARPMALAMSTPGAPRTPEEAWTHAIIGFARRPSVASSRIVGETPLRPELFAFRTDSDLAALAALRAGVGLGVCQAPLAARDPDLIPVEVQLLGFELGVWVVMHEDLKGVRRMRLLFDHLVEALRVYVRARRPARATDSFRRFRLGDSCNGCAVDPTIGGRVEFYGSDGMADALKYPSPEALMARASETTGLTDFGPDAFQEGLAMLLHSLEREANLDPRSQAQMLGTISRRLESRLEIADWRRAHPEIAALPVPGMVSIMGLPRTGTTALVNMMSLDDDVRCLRAWEQVRPCPPPIAGEDQEDPRRLAAIAQHDAAARAYPERMALHLFEPDATEEDIEVLGTDFKAQQLLLPMFSYHAWWRDLDMRSAFEYHRGVLQLLQSRRPPNRWLLKAPAHTFHLPSIVHAYPDARFIMTHRDPAKCVVSSVSFVSAMAPPGVGIHKGPEELGRQHAAHLRIGVERAIAARAQIGEDRFFDVHHREFVADPFGTLERIYRFLGRELRPHVRQKMQAWHAANQSGAHGRHRYTAEQFGLSTAQLHSDFDFYMRRFDIPAEA
jgi:hypothetical protein